jgi:hypothetical protein
VLALKTMNYTITHTEKESIRKLKEIGISEIWIYKSHSYVTAVTFLLVDETHISLKPQDRHVEGRFEVFVISAENRRIDTEPVKKLEAAHYSNVNNVSILSKCDWEVPTSNTDKEELLGDPVGSTTVFEGREVDMPKDVLNFQKYDAGIRIDFEEGAPFYVVTGYPFELAISDNLSLSQIDESIYELRIQC